MRPAAMSLVLISLALLAVVRANDDRFCNSDADCGTDGVCNTRDSCCSTLGCPDCQPGQQCYSRPLGRCRAPWPTDGPCYCPRKKACSEEPFPYTPEWYTARGNKADVKQIRAQAPDNGWNW